MAGLFVAACVAALVVAWHSYTAGVQEERAEAANRHQVSAVTTEDAPSGKNPHAKLGQPWTQVPARWTGPDDAPREGLVAVAAGTVAGTHLTIWIDDAGRAVAAPQEHSATAGQAVLAGLVVAGSAAAALLVTGRGIRCRLDRQRLAPWDAEWARVGPQWSRGR